MTEFMSWGVPALSTYSMLNSGVDLTYDQGLPYLYYIKGSVGTNVVPSFQTHMQLMGFGWA